jgi:glycosyltransferase involved in cell wall biosynthesis
MKTDLSIVIPAFEEQVRLGDSLLKILLYIEKNSLRAELIVVDDGSSDRTAEIARDACAEFPKIKTNVIRYEKNRGKGYAVKTGLLASSGDIALFSDADLSTPIEELPKVVEPIRAGEFDVVFGSRELDKSLINTHQSWRREQGGRVFNFVVRSMTGLPFLDTQCGFKAFNMLKFRPLLPLMQIERFGFDIEFLYVAFHKGLRLAEIPVVWNHCEGTKVEMWRDSRRTFNEVRLIRRNAKQGKYNL